MPNPREAQALLHGSSNRGPLPARLGRYDLLREIGSGGMGRVYEGVHRAIGRPVAIKLLNEGIAADPLARARFVTEGRAIGRLRHPHIVQIFDMEDDEGTPFLVMELLEGTTLAEHLAHRGPLPLTEVVDLVLPIASALAAAHAIGVVHRDVKPSNVFLRKGRDLSPCLLDFGVSKTTGVQPDGDALTASGALVGTIPYFSPEHARGARNVTAQSDQFALAIVVYECITGVRPFSGEDQYELMIATVRAEVQPLSAVRPDMPPALDAVLLRALRADPQERFPSMRAFGSALLAFASREAWRAWAPEFTGVAPPPSHEVTTHDANAEPGLAASVGSASPSPRRLLRPLAIGGACTLVAATVAVAGYRVNLGHDAAPPIQPAVASTSPSSVPPSVPPSAAPLEIVASTPVVAPSAVLAPPPRTEPSPARAPKPSVSASPHVTPAQSVTKPPPPAVRKDPLEQWD